MNIPFTSLQFSGRILIRKNQLAEGVKQNTDDAATAEIPVDPDLVTEDNFVQTLGAGKWTEGDLDFGTHQAKNFVQAKTVNSNDPQADLKAIETLAAKGIEFAFLPTEEKNTMQAADTVTTDMAFVRKQVIKSQPVAYTTNPEQATAQHLLDEKA